MNSLIKKIIVLVTASFLGVVIIAISILWAFSNKLPDYKFLQNYKPPVSSKLYSGSGQLVAEFSSEKHTRGTVSMARAQDPNSADSQFFICFTDASWLDGQYTIWGQVVEGMDHVDKIKKGDGSNGEVSNPDKIISMKLVSKKPKKTKK